MRTIVKLLLNESRLHDCIHKHQGANVDKWCRKCGDFRRETLIHVFTQCPSTRNLRNEKWCHVHNACVPNLAEDLTNLNPNMFLSFILNALNCRYVHEWSEMYEAILNYIYTVYMFHIKE